MDILTPYQFFLLAVLIVWPIAIGGILYFMNRLESYVQRLDADTPEEAGLEPVEGAAEDREVRVVFGDRVVGEPD